MSYLCSVCKSPSEPKQPRRVHVIYRELPKPDGGVKRQIEREIPVCADCWHSLESGETLAGLTKRHTPKPDRKVNKPVLELVEHVPDLPMALAKVSLPNRPDALDQYGGNKFHHPGVPAKAKVFIAYGSDPFEDDATHYEFFLDAEQAEVRAAELRNAGMFVSGPTKRGNGL